LAADARAGNDISLTVAGAAGKTDDQQGKPRHGVSPDDARVQ
jgi:hypothetical protein